MKLLNIDPNSSKPPLFQVLLTIVAVIIIEFASPRAGTIVEGSPSAVIDASASQPIVINPDSNYHPFIEAVNSPEINYISRTIIVTAYSSTPDQTDNTPFITASGEIVHDGIIASNFLPFGTKVQFPQLFGSKIFQVEDRMHQKYSDKRVDIWFPDRASAEIFGIKKTTMVIVK